MKVLLALILAYTTFQVHLPSYLGIPGVNVINILVAVAFVIIFLVGRRGERLDRPMLAGPMLAYFAAMILATVIAVAARQDNLMDDLTYLKTTLFYPLFYLLFYYGIRTRREVWRLVALGLVLAVLAAGEAWWQAIELGVGIYEESHRAWGPFGENHRSSNLAGLFYAMFVPVFASLLVLQRSSTALRVVAAIALVITLGAVVFTYSRSAYAVTLIALALVAWKRGVGTIAVLALMGMLALPFLPEGATQRVQETQVVDEHGMVRLEESAASRPEIWAGALEMWSRAPMGVGHGRFPEEIGHYSDHAGMDAHNFFVLTLAEAGVFGLLALVWLVARLWRLGRWMTWWSTSDLAAIVTWSFQAMLICIVLGNMFSSFFREGALMGMVWALAGSLERLTQISYEEAMEEAGEAGEPGTDTQDADIGMASSGSTA
ncbi:O-antigen ligase family protein [Alkalisalibacterium limincola]|uniref:O-antigen ligase family protein n=1 Tax=Alkalisalibacterium limincola TaxID=2699169 RepID=A0A5C8KWJ3_9GAMM|nr:O-antigen ligase family protein [Alkalisalibacterium limincola]TXK64478.1 O-antigen ligase family protein [Alkalisalibacterium limincola]